MTVETIQQTNEVGNGVNSQSIEQVLTRLREAVAKRLEREQELINKLEELDSELQVVKAQYVHASHDFQQLQEKHKELIAAHKEIADGIDKPVAELKTILGKYYGTSGS